MGSSSPNGGKDISKVMKMELSSRPVEEVWTKARPRARDNRVMPPRRTQKTAEERIKREKEGCVKGNKDLSCDSIGPNAMVNVLWRGSGFDIWLPEQDWWGKEIRDPVARDPWKMHQRRRIRDLESNGELESTPNNEAKG